MKLKNETSQKIRRSYYKNEDESLLNPEVSFSVGIFFVNITHRKPAETLSFCGFFLFCLIFQGGPVYHRFSKWAPREGLEFSHFEGIPPKCRDFKAGSFSLQARQRTRHGRTVFMEAKGRAQGSTSRHLFFFVSESLRI